MSDDRRRTAPRGLPVRRLPTLDADQRPRRPSEEYGWSRFEQQVLQGFEKIDDAVAQLGTVVGDLSTRLASLEHHRAFTGKVWNFVLGLVAVVLGALLLTILKLGK